MSKGKGILVLGAGELGLSVVKSLMAHPSGSEDVGTQIWVALRPATLNNTRNPVVQKLLALDFELEDIVPIDLVKSSEEDLVEDFRPFHTIIGCMGYAAANKGVQGLQTKLCNAVLKAGVKRYFPWCFGLDYPVLGQGSEQKLFDEQLEVRRMLEAQTEAAEAGKGTDWVIIPVGVFMSFLLEKNWGVLEAPENGGTNTEGIVRALGSWDTPITVTASEDIGRCVAEIVFQDDPKVFKNETVYLSSETLTYGQLADKVEKGLGRKLTREEWSVDALEQDLSSDPNNGLKAYRVVFAKGVGTSWPADNTFNVQKGLDMTSIEDHARALKKASGY